MKDMNKVKELINKLLAVTSENGATENEVITATLKVQQILAKYDMTMADIGEVNTDEIIEIGVDTSRDLWKYSLATVIADNFCCKVFALDKKITFYGYRRHCETATEVFNTIYNFGRKRASEIYKEYSRQGYNPKGIKNQFYIGFVAGVKNALEAQSRSLMVIIPEEVKQSYDKKMVGAHTMTTNMTYRKSDEVYDRGVAAGREIAGQKVIS